MAVSDSAYHHGHLREALVEAAITAARERGPDGLAIRDLARRVGVSHNAAYRHFANRDALVTEVAGRVMEQLMSAMLSRLRKVDAQDPILRARRRLAETGRAYVDYAITEPGLFRLALTSLSTVTAASPYPDRDPLHLLSQVLDDLVEVGFLSAEARVDAELTCWSAMHGFSVLSIDGPLRLAEDVDRSSALDRVLVAIDRSYAATTGAHTEPNDLI